MLLIGGAVLSRGGSQTWSRLPRGPNRSAQRRSRQQGVSLLSNVLMWRQNQRNAPFRLTRWFAVLSLIVISAVTVSSAVALSKIMEKLMLERDGVVAQGFVQTLLKGQDVKRFFASIASSSALPGLGNDDDVFRVERVLAQITAMTDVIHTNVYDIERRIVWSSAPDAKNKILTGNPELDEALEGKLTIEIEDEDETHADKPEHQLIKNRNQRFVENYIPIFEPDGKTVLGVVEIYKSPAPVFDTIKTFMHWIWLSALLSGLALFAALLWIMRRADRVIRHQQRQLLASESMVAVGEMASAVAHSIRNPLASIRSSAELWADETAADVQESARDIVSEVDRMEEWVRSLLVYAHEPKGAVDSLDLNELVKTVVNGYGREFTRLDIATRFDLAGALPRFKCNSGLLTHVLNSVITNALEAMPSGGSLVALTRVSSDGDFLELHVTDSGVGMTQDRIAKAFQLFGTSKRKGLGLGLPIVRRTLERMGGGIWIESTPGAGTRVTLSFPVNAP